MARSRVSSSTPGATAATSSPPSPCLDGGGVRRRPDTPQRALALARRGGGPPVILLTGATGTVGTALLRRLTDELQPVRCLVRDPRRLGDQRVRVQIALGDLADPASFPQCPAWREHRGAPRGVDPRPAARLDRGANGMATLRLVRAAERAGARRFLFFSALGATTTRAPASSAPRRWRRTLSRTPVSRPPPSARRSSTRPAIPGSRCSSASPICPRSRCPAPATPSTSRSGRRTWRTEWWPLCATVERMITHATSSPGPTPVLRRHRAAGAAFVGAPSPSAARAASARSRILRGLRLLVGPHVFATWDEAELMEEPMVAARGPPTPRRSGCGPTRWPPCSDSPAPVLVRWRVPREPGLTLTFA